MADSLALTIAGAPEADAEGVYDDLLGHLTDCRRCWEWREALWRTDRLCSAGVALVDAYAAAVCGVEAETTRPSGRIRLEVIEGAPAGSSSP
jgi:hypothetical protein